MWFWLVALATVWSLSDHIALIMKASTTAAVPRILQKYQKLARRKPISLLSLIHTITLTTRAACADAASDVRNASSHQRELAQGAILKQPWRTQQHQTRRAAGVWQKKASCRALTANAVYRW
jgi:hypothetical protein